MVTKGVVGVHKGVRINSEAVREVVASNVEGADHHVLAMLLDTWVVLAGKEALRLLLRTRICGSILCNS